MALQVWLPLTKDINNQGVSGVSFNNTNSSIIKINSSGKLGNCYERTDSSGNYLYSNNTVHLGTNLSMFCWINFTSLQSSASLTGICGTHRPSTNTGMGITIKYVSSTTGYISCNTGTGSDRTFNTYCGSTLLSAGTWYHVGFTYDGSNIKLYVNGQLDKTQSFTGMSVQDDYFLVYNWSFRGTSGTEVNSYASPYKLNDVRAYDHCLSPREVAELAKGLVLHYPLNRDGFGLDNILKTTYTLASNWGTNQGTISNGVATITPTSDSSRRIFQTPALGGWSWQASTTYTVSVEARSDDGAKLIIGPYGSGAANSSEMAVTSKWKRYSYTFTSTASPSTSSLSFLVSQASGVTLQMRRPKMEISSVATPWIPNSADTEYSIFGLNSTTVPDTSGYGHNGTANGTFIVSSDTPRYDVSTIFNGTSSKIQLLFNIFNSDAKNPQMSFAFWMKRNNYTDSTEHYMYTDICRIYTHTDYTVRIQWSHSTTSTSSTNTWHPSLSIPANEWHHICFTFDSGVMKVYKDGSLFGTSDRSNTGQYIGVLNEHRIGCNSDNTKFYGGSLSDIRIYATTLSDNDVKALYEQSASIANNGTMFAYEFNEI